MASGYHTVESDDRLESGNDGLEFKSFLGAPTPPNGNTSAPGRINTGYFQDAPTQPASFWTVEYYQKYFDIDTKVVLQRCYTTLLPLSPNYLTSHTTPSPDLYGPFWTLTTLIFSLFVFSSFTASLVNYLSPTAEIYEYDFTRLSVAVTLVYTYGLVVPILVWGALKYMGVTAEEWSVFEALSSWGYAMFVWIPISLLCIIPSQIVRWVLVGLGFATSGWFLFSNVYPIILLAPNKSSRILLPVLVVLHAGIALTFKILYFSYYINPDSGTKVPVPGEGETPAPVEGLLRALF